MRVSEVEWLTQAQRTEIVRAAGEDFELADEKTEADLRESAEMIRFAATLRPAREDRWADDVPLVRSSVGQ